MSPDDPIVTFERVTKEFASTARGGSPRRAVDAVDLEIRTGEIFGIIGYSGAGKSTLVRLINALERASEGRIVVDGVEVTALPERELRRLRGRIGMIFQQFNLFRSQTVWANVEYPLIVAGIPRAERDRRVGELLAFVGLGDKAAAYPDQLSGGQKQRVGIARALANRPRILLADEATSALDPETTSEVLALLRRVNESLGTTIVVITHEMEVIKSLAHRVAVMEEGRVIEQGDVYRLFSAPRTDAAKRFVGTVVQGAPAPAELAAIRARHPGRIITVALRDEGAEQAQVFAALVARGVEFELVHGGIDDIQGRVFGSLTLSLRGEPAAVDIAIAELSRLVPVTEAA